MFRLLLIIKNSLQTLKLSEISQNRNTPFLRFCKKAFGENFEDFKASQQTVVEITVEINLNFV
jgi:hypothetical protein